MRWVERHAVIQEFKRYGGVIQGQPDLDPMWFQVGICLNEDVVKLRPVSGGATRHWSG
jgi:hypothetical protein